MANVDNVQLPDGSSYNIVDNTSGFATQNYVDSAVSSVTKTTIGLGNVDNTSDLNKPISTATQAALNTLDEDKADKTDIAPVESSSTASQTYQIGEQFYYNGLLYKATAVINSGGTITPNGNCVLSDSVIEQIKANYTDLYGRISGSITVSSSYTTEKQFCQKLGATVKDIDNHSCVVRDITWQGHNYYMGVFVRQSDNIFGVITSGGYIMTFTYSRSAGTASGATYSGTAF